MKRDDLIAMGLPLLEQEGLDLYEFFDEDCEEFALRPLQDEEDFALEREALEQSRRRVSRAQRRDEWR